MQVDGYSLEAQNDRLTKYAEFQDMEVVKVYCDAGKFGKNIAGRPEFTQMLQDVADGKDGVDYILVFKLSRFGRNAADAEIERENILVQTMEGRKQKVREGKWNGGQAPFGYTLDSKNSTLIVNPEEAELVKLMY